MSDNQPKSMGFNPETGTYRIDDETILALVESLKWAWGLPSGDTVAMQTVSNHASANTQLCRQFSLALDPAIVKIPKFYFPLCTQDARGVHRPMLFRSNES